MPTPQTSVAVASEPRSIKSAATAFFAALSDDDTAALAEIIDPEASFWVLAHRRSVPAGAWLAGYRQLIRDRAPDGVQFVVSTLTAEEDRVAAIVECHAAFDDGRVYDNRYHFLLRVDGGRIVELWEYGDTLHAERVLRGE